MEILENVNQVVGEAVDETAEGVRKVSRVVFREFPLFLFALILLAPPLILVMGLHEILNGDALAGYIAVGFFPFSIVMVIFLGKISGKSTFCTDGINHRGQWKGLLHKGSSRRQIAFFSWNEITKIHIEHKRRGAMKYYELCISNNNKTIKISTQYVIRQRALVKIFVKSCPRKDLIDMIDPFFNIIIK